jgi:hypothetical protein
LHAKCQARRWFSELHSSCFFVFFFRLWLRPFCKYLLIVWKKERNTKTLTREEVGGEWRRGLTLQVRTWGGSDWSSFFLSFYESFVFWKAHCS